MAVLDDIVSKGDVTQFNDFRYMVGHHGQRPPSQHLRSPLDPYGGSPGGYSPYNGMAPGRAPNGAHQQLSPHGKREPAARKEVLRLVS